MLLQRALALLLTAAASVEAVTFLDTNTGALSRHELSPSKIWTTVSPPSSSDNESTNVECNTTSEDGVLSITCGTDNKAAVGAAGLLSSTVMVEIPNGYETFELLESQTSSVLRSLFGAKLFALSETEGTSVAATVEKTTLVLAVHVEGEETSAAYVDDIIKQVGDIFALAAAATGKMNVDITDLYDIDVEMILNPEDIDHVKQRAIDATAQSAFPKTDNASIAFGELYNKLKSNSNSAAVSSVIESRSPRVLAALLSVDDSYARLSRAARAKLNPWSNRVDRGLTVDKFGSQATLLYEKTLESFDLETISSVANSETAEYRLKIRSKLKSFLEESLRQLFAQQIVVLEKSTLKKFNSSLLKLKSSGKNKATATVDYDDNAAALRSAAFGFDTAMDDLEIPTLSLRKSGFTDGMKEKLSKALTDFSDTPAAKLKDIMTFDKKSKRTSKPPKQRSIEAGLGLVAMLRPDGFGNLQGFAGYTAGPHSVIVGIHNDADAPETINQFGGSRPPLLRVQPKLNLDIEL